MVRGHTRILIIGCGVTGAGIARDLSLRGVECMVLDSGDYASGASGANHGLLHSGARYAVKDLRAASECASESAILKKIAPHCIEETGGFFVSLPGDDENYISDFENSCSEANVVFQGFDVRDAIETEPSLNRNITAAYAVNDATIDPFRLTMENLEDARLNGCKFMPYTKVKGFSVSSGRIRSVKCVNRISGAESEIYADFIINASGAWAGHIAAHAGIFIPVICGKGTLMVTSSRVAGMVVNRLRKPSDGDIVVPGGTVSITGTTSSIVNGPDSAFPLPSETDLIIKETSMMLPELSSTRYIRAFSGVRPLFDTGSGSEGRGISRGYILRDHYDDGVENFATISGGKLTTYRLMAEKTADLVCSRIGVDAECVTHSRKLPDSRATLWSIPGASARHSLMTAPDTGILGRKKKKMERLLCECELITESVIDEVVADLVSQGREVSLTEIGLRTRFGKGSCQGCGCSLRIAAYLHEKGFYNGNEGIHQTKAMIQNRWKGFKPVVWGEAAAQMEFQDAVQCGIFNMERQ